MRLVSRFEASQWRNSVISFEQRLSCEVLRVPSVRKRPWPARGASSPRPRFRRASIYPRQDLLQICKEPLPPVFGALVGLLLIRPEARLLHAQVGPGPRRGESPSDDTLETIGTP